MLIAVIIAILWLLHRTTRLLKVPAPALIHVLGIDIPETPRVSVDGITPTTVNLHWTAPTMSREKFANVVKYIVQVDNRGVGEVDRLDTKLTLKDLRPGTEYVIRVVAVNSSKYRSHPATLVVHTLREEESSGVCGFTTGGFWTITSDSSGVATTSIIGTSSSSSTSAAATGSTGSGSTVTNRQRSQSKSVASKQQIQQQKEKADRDSRAYSIEGLTQEVESVQSEINELLINASHLEEDFEKNQSALLEELDRLKSVKRTDDQHRSQLKAETKLLEESKRALEAQRTKVDKQRKQLEVEFAKREELQTQWESGLAESSDRLKALDAQIEELESESAVEFADINRKILDKQESLIKLETDIATMSAQIQNIDANKATTLVELEALKEITDPITGLISDEATFEQFLNNDAVLDRAKEAVQKDLQIDQELEVDWQATQKGLELRYVEVNQNYSNAKSAFERAQHHQQQYNYTTISASASRRGSTASRMDTLVQVPVTPRMSAYGNGIMATTSAPAPGPHHQNNSHDAHTNMTPSVDMLLPSNLFASGDGDVDDEDKEEDRSHITESFAREIAFNDQQHRISDELDSASVASHQYYVAVPNRPSASLLATAFQYGNSPAESLRSTTVSPKASMLSLRDKSSMGPSVGEPYASFLGYQGSVHSLLDNNDGRSIHSDTGRRSKKAGSIFFSRNKANNPTVLDDAHSLEATTSRARTGSIGSSLFSPWADQGMIRPTVSGNESASVLSVDVASNWSVFDKVAPRSSFSSSVHHNMNGKNTNEPQTLGPGLPNDLASSYNSSADSVLNSMADITTSDTAASKNSRKGLKGFFYNDKEKDLPPQSPLKENSPWGKLDKSFAALFTDDKEKEKEKDKEKEKEKEKEKDKDKEKDGSRESILQKSMRSFSSSRKTSSSSKFVRRLSLFGKKGDHRNDLEGLEIPEMTIVEDEDEKE